MLRPSCAVFVPGVIVVAAVGVTVTPCVAWMWMLRLWMLGTNCATISPRPLPTRTRTRTRPPPQGRGSSGQGFVEYELPAAAQMAVEKMNNQVIKERQVRRFSVVLLMFCCICWCIVVVVGVGVWLWLCWDRRTGLWGGRGCIGRCRTMDVRPHLSVVCCGHAVTVDGVLRLLHTVY